VEIPANAVDKLWTALWTSHDHRPECAPKARFAGPSATHSLWMKNAAPEFFHTAGIRRRAARYRVFVHISRYGK
jgi:hypothetical protein